MLSPTAVRGPPLIFQTPRLKENQIFGFSAERIYAQGNMRQGWCLLRDFEQISRWVNKKDFPRKMVRSTRVEYGLFARDSHYTGFIIFIQGFEFIVSKGLPRNLNEIMEWFLKGTYLVGLDHKNVLREGTTALLQTKVSLVERLRKCPGKGWGQSCRSYKLGSQAWFYKRNVISISATFTASIVNCAGIPDSWLVRGIHQTLVSIAFPFPGIYSLFCLSHWVLGMGWRGIKRTLRRITKG